MGMFPSGSRCYHVQAKIYVMHFRCMAAIFDLSLPVTSDSTDNMYEISSELNDLGNLEVAIGMSMYSVLSV